MQKRKYKSILKAAALVLFLAYSYWNTGRSDNTNLPVNATSQSTYNLTGTVVNIADGDTLTLLQGQKRLRIRLASIDAPETGHGKTRPSQPYSTASKNALSAMVAKKTVTLKCYEQDRYQREICDVPLADGDTANRQLVAQGLAWANMQGDGKYLRDASIRDLQAQAKSERRGLWQQPDPVAPWDWRWQCWNKLETGQSSPIC